MDREILSEILVGISMTVQREDGLRFHCEIKRTRIQFIICDNEYTTALTDR